MDASVRREGSSWQIVADTILYSKRSRSKCYAAPGRVADSLGNILIERARAGVSVSRLYDAFGSSLTDQYLASLRAAGVHARRFGRFDFASSGLCETVRTSAE